MEELENVPTASFINMLHVLNKEVYKYLKPQIMVSLSLVILAILIAIFLLTMLISRGHDLLLPHCLCIVK